MYSVCYNRIVPVDDGFVLAVRAICYTKRKIEAIILRKIFRAKEGMLTHYSVSKVKDKQLSLLF